MPTLRTFFPLSISAFVLAASVTCASVTCGGGVVEENETDMKPAPSFIPLLAPQHYIVRYMGITCGHMVLESRLEELDGQPAYHIIMTAQNSKFFNQIYKVTGRIDSWIDVESRTTIAYRSVIEEKGETSIKQYDVNSAEGTVVRTEDDATEVMTFTPSTPVLDPLAYMYRLQVLAREPGESVALTLLTTDGAIETVAAIGEMSNRRTRHGPRDLLEVRPRPADGQMFSRKGEVSLWIDPADDGRLFILDFKLSFGHLVAKID